MRAGTDVTAVRYYTAASLWVVIISITGVQLIVAAGIGFDARVIALSAVALLVTVLVFSLTGHLMGGLGTGSIAHPRVIALTIASLAVWAIAAAEPFLGWGWAISPAVAAGVLICGVTGWWRLAVMVGLLCAVVATRIIALLIAGVSPSWRAFVADEAFFGLSIAVVVIVPFSFLSIIWGLDVVVRLDRARGLAAELAIARERLRFATDLHDIQGHNLQVIALKSELAERLMPIDPEAAAREMGAIRAITQSALDDTRAVVHDYRTVTVAVELRNAASILRSAGIEATVRVQERELPESVGTVLGVAIREATTNILRHSKATSASIELAPARSGDGRDEYRLTVTNDGALTRVSRDGGTGLRGLAARVESAGGVMTAGRDGQLFVLTVMIPAGNDRAGLGADRGNLHGAAPAAPRKANDA